MGPNNNTRKGFIATDDNFICNDVICKTLNVNKIQNGNSTVTFGSDVIFGTSDHKITIDFSNATVKGLTIRR